MLQAKRGIETRPSTTLQSNPQSNRAPAELFQSNRATAMSSLQELFPTYGQGFLEACLTCFVGQVDQAIDALLTENLPPSLVKLDRSLKVINSTPLIHL